MQILSSHSVHKVLFEKQVLLAASAPSASASPSWRGDWRSQYTHSFALFVDNHKSVSLKCARSTMECLRFFIGNMVIGCHRLAGVCLFFFQTHADAVNSRDTLERALEQEPRLGESASSQQALPHFSMNQRVNHADFVVSSLSTKYSLKQALLGAGAPSA